MEINVIVIFVYRVCVFWWRVAASSVWQHWCGASVSQSVVVQQEEGRHVEDAAAAPLTSYVLNSSAPLRQFSVCVQVILICTCCDILPSGSSKMLSVRNVKYQWLKNHSTRF